MSKKQIKTPNKKEQEDDSTQRLFYGYRKRCDNYGIPALPDIRSKLEAALQSNEFQLLHITEQIGCMQIRALMQVATQLKYQHLKRIRIWKGGIGDEGVRNICKYLASVYSLELLDLLNNGITPLGCQFLGKTMNNPLCKIKHLKLDNNLILTSGLKELAIGLRQNLYLDKLSLKYCGIDGQGARFIQQALANIHSKLRSIKLQGNPLGNQGVYQILRAIECSDSLQKINFADCKMQLLDYKPDRDSMVEKLAALMINMMQKNILIIKWDIRFNPLDDGIAEQMLKSIQANVRIKKMEFPTNVAYELRDGLDTILRKRNKTGKGKPKKKK